MSRTIDGLYSVDADDINTVELIVSGTALINNLDISSLELDAPLSVTSGGTGQDSLAAVTVGKATNVAGGSTGQVLVQTNTDDTVFLTPGVSGTVLTSNGVASLPTFETVDTSNIPGGAVGDILYQSASGVTSFISPGASGEVLTSNGPLVMPTYQPSSSYTPVMPLFFRYQGGSSYTSTAGCVYIEVAICGGGGGGGGCNAIGSPSSGGGGGSFATYVLSPGTYSFSVGAAGTAGPIGTVGGNGGNTVFGIYTAFGGTGGGSGSSGVKNGGAGGALPTAGYRTMVRGSRGGSSILETSAPSCQGGFGGSSFYSHSCGTPLPATDGLNALTFGGGGSGCNRTSGVGGSGFQGVIQVTEYF